MGVVLRFLIGCLPVLLLTAASCGENEGESLPAQPTATLEQQTPVGATVVHSCDELPDGLVHSQLAIESPPGGEQRYVFVLSGGDWSYHLVLSPGDSTEGCDEFVRQVVGFADDPSLLKAVDGWVSDQGGELIGDCSASGSSAPAEGSGDQSWCYFLPKHEQGAIVIDVQSADRRYTLRYRQEGDGLYTFISAEPAN